MKEILRRILASFDTVTNDGFSARKLSAFVVILLVISAHIIWFKHAYKHEDFALLGEVLMIDFAFIGACLGMTTWEKIKLKGDKPSEPAN